MTRILPLLALLLAYGPASGAQTPSPPELDCARVCVFPDTAPPECECVVIGVNATSDIDNPDPRAKEILDNVRDTYAREVADVHNYAVVQTTSAGGPPVALYYEKVIIDNYPAFRLVGPSELANREAEERGDPTAPQILGAVADLIGGLSGAEPDGESDRSPDASEPSSPSSSGIPVPSGVLGEIERTLNEIATAHVVETREALADEIWRELIYLERLKFKETGPCPPWYSNETCHYLEAHAEEFDTSDSPYEGFEIERISYVVLTRNNSNNPISMAVDLRNTETGEVVTITRQRSDFDPERRWIPKRTKLTMANAKALSESIQENVLEIVEMIVDAVFNAEITQTRLDMMMRPFMPLVD